MLVGPLGGLMVRYYQSKHPADVVGIVLVDSSHEESLQHVGLKMVRVPELSATQFQLLIDEGKANRPKNPEPDLVPSTIFPPYDKLPAQLLPLVNNWGLNLQFDLSRLHQMRDATRHPLGNMPVVVLTAKDRAAWSAG